MKISDIGKIAGILFAGTALSCINIDERLGKNLIPYEQQYEVHTFRIPLEECASDYIDNLSGFSSSRITIGAIRDNDYGLSTRSSAFALVPALDTLDFGTDPIVTSFHFAVAIDTFNVKKSSDQYLLQNAYIYELEESVDYEKYSTNRTLKHGNKRISKTVPVINGKDSLSFDFTQEFADKFLTITEDDLDTIPNYLKRFPGIYIETDLPDGDGGRINIFKLSCLSLSSGYYYRNNNGAWLRINSEYDGVRKDTAFFFIPGEYDFYDEVSLLSDNTAFYQYAFNMTSQESQALKGVGGQNLWVEGGGGLKPVVRAKEMRDKLIAKLTEAGVENISETIINKATLSLPFEEPEDYLDFGMFPEMLSPTCQIVSTDDEGETSIAFAGLTDASSSSENQGDLDRSILSYHPDITHHLQQVLRKEDEDLSNYDIWFLTIHSETTETASTTSQAEQEYYQNLMYASYYNQLYNGYGYGSYSSYGYGSYSGYGNYYNYLMLAAMMSQSSSTSTSTSQELDKDRFYKVKLNGPEAARYPELIVTCSIPLK